MVGIDTGQGWDRYRIVLGLIQDRVGINTGFGWDKKLIWEGINTAYRTGVDTERGLTGRDTGQDKDQIQNGVRYRIKAVRARGWNQIMRLDTELGR